MSNFGRHLHRCNYAFALAVVLTGILVVIDMLFRFGVGRYIFSRIFGGLAFGCSYLLAPLIEEKLNLFG